MKKLLVLFSMILILSSGCMKQEEVPEEKPVVFEVESDGIKVLSSTLENQEIVLKLKNDTQESVVLESVDIAIYTESEEIAEDAFITQLKEEVKANEEYTFTNKVDTKNIKKIVIVVHKG